MERIGEYEVRRMVGEGGMGKVYEAEERLSKRRVALKVLRPELTRSEEGRRLFLNEMQILAQLEHPNVVRSLATCEVDGQLVMALEFLEGRTLREELVDKGRLPWPEAVRIVVAIGEGLAAAHAQEPAIVHRDLKPENVMLVDGEHVKVMDFGVAKVLAAAQATNTQSVGTLQYMSPEQIDARTIDARSDLYALGLVLYECLAGAPPFRSASARELLNLQCTAAGSGAAGGGAGDAPGRHRGGPLPDAREVARRAPRGRARGAREARAVRVGGRAGAAVGLVGLAPEEPGERRAGVGRRHDGLDAGAGRPAARGHRGPRRAGHAAAADLDARRDGAHPAAVGRGGADGVRAAPPHRDDRGGVQ